MSRGVAKTPSTAHIERAQFHRARSARKEGTWPLLPHPSKAARCASKRIVPTTPFPFQHPDYSTRYPLAARQVSRIALIVESPCRARAWSAKLWEPALKGKGEPWL